MVSHYSYHYSSTVAMLQLSLSYSTKHAQVNLGREYDVEER